jgi:hypothetical protein
MAPEDIAAIAAQSAAHSQSEDSVMTIGDAPPASHRAAVDGVCRFQAYRSTVERLQSGTNFPPICCFLHPDPGSRRVRHQTPPAIPEFNHLFVS